MYHQLMTIQKKKKIEKMTTFRKFKGKRKNRNGKYSKQNLEEISLNEDQINNIINNNNNYIANINYNSTLKIKTKKILYIIIVK